ncbi:thioredoxin family protein [bacterium]|nr:thioredoxin family protein [bacterium]
MREIKVFGSCCSKCATMYYNCRAALDAENLQGTVSKVEEVIEITKNGIMFTPALMIDDVLVSEGKLLTVKQIRALLVK